MLIFNKIQYFLPETFTLCIFTQMLEWVIMRADIRESVDSLCRDDADMPMPPYIRKACNRPNAACVSLFMYLTVIYGCFST